MTSGDAAHCVLALLKWAEDLDSIELATAMRERAYRVAKEFDVDTEALHSMMRMCRD